MFFRILICVATCNLFFGTSIAQTTIWEVDFETGYSDNDLTAQDNNTPTGADWTKSGSATTWWRVESANFISGSLSMSGRNTDGVMTWTSESISISSYTDVSISIDIKEVNCEAGDIIETFYSIDGGGNTEFGNTNGDGNFNNATNTVSGLSGSSMTLVVTLNCNAGNERILFDNIEVTGTPVQGPDGPGGVGDVDGSGTLEVWLMADDLDGDGDLTDNPSNGSSVSTWGDLSGNSQDFTQSGSNRPSYSTSGTYNAVDFDASGSTAEYLDATSTGSYTGASAFFAANPTNSGQSNSLFDNGSYSLRVEQYSNTGDVGFTRYGVSDYSTSISSPFGSNSIMSFHKASSSSNMDIHVNGSTETLAIGSSAAGIPYDRLGKNSSGADEISGDFYEVILFSEDLNDAQIVIIENYLSAKYGGISIPNDLYDEDTGANGDFDYDVAGIGQASDGTSHEDAQGTGIIRISNPSGLGNSEYLFWGHDNGALNSSGVTDLPTGVESRLAREWRVSETGEVGTVTLSMDLTGIIGSITASDLRLLVDSDNDGSFSDESGSSVISGATNTSGNIYEWTGVDLENNQRFTLGSIDFSQTPLPIELIRFDAHVTVFEQVEVEWETASEINNDYFTVERSADSEHWDAIGTIPGAGNSQELNVYSFMDIQPLKGQSYYRLKQTDFDGKYTVSAVEQISLNEEADNEVISAFPNPVRDVVVVEGSGFDGHDIQVINQYGLEVGRFLPIYSRTDTWIQVDMSSLKTGMYHVMIGQQTLTLIKE